jgi:hypothetical protein
MCESMTTTQLPVANVLIAVVTRPISGPHPLLVGM